MITVWRIAVLSLSTLLVAACAGPAGVGGVAPDPSPIVAGDEHVTAPSAPVEATPVPTPGAAAYSKLRVFVASESTNSVWVLEGAKGRSYELVGKIPVGTMPHQMATSPDGKWVAVNNRMANTTSIIDPIAMKEVVRLAVGKQPHAIGWSPDGKMLFVGHERDTYIARFDTTTWKALPPLMVGVPQHVVTIPRGHPNEVWFTLTNTSEADVLRIYDLETNKITRVKVSDVHDAYFTPDESEVWSSSSGFLDKPSDRMVIYDPTTKTVKSEIHLVGHYPFHTMKVDQDGVFFLRDQSIMVISDHAMPGLMFVDWRERKIVGETKLGQQPFHTAYDPEGERFLTTTNVDGMVNVIDARTHEVLQKVPVPKAHGIGAVPIP